MSGIEAVKHYLTMRKKQPLLGLSDEVHAIHRGTTNEAMLTLRDLESAVTELEAQIGQFQPVITIGFDKNGEADFRISMSIAELSYDQMNDFRRIIPPAIAQSERLWFDHGPMSKDVAMQAGASKS